MSHVEILARTLGILLCAVLGAFLLHALGCTWAVSRVVAALGCSFGLWNLARAALRRPQEAAPLKPARRHSAEVRAHF